MPKVVNDTDNFRCDLKTDKREVELAQIPGWSCEQFHQSEAFLSCLTLGSIYSAATLVVSGSIVLVGNTVHWVEKKAKCDRQVDLNDLVVEPGKVL